jgi:hypothetical protein
MQSFFDHPNILFNYTFYLAIALINVLSNSPNKRGFPEIYPALPDFSKLVLGLYKYIINTIIKLFIYIKKNYRW